MYSTIKEAVAAMPEGTSLEAWYAIVYAKQCRPCVFRRAYHEVSAGGEARELTPEQSEEIRNMIADGMDQEEAFQAFEPGYVTIGEFHAEWLRQRLEKAKTGEVVTPEVAPEVVVVPEETETVIYPDPSGDEGPIVETRKKRRQR